MVGLRLERIEQRRAAGAPTVVCFSGDVERAWEAWDAFERASNRRALRVGFGGGLSFQLVESCRERWLEDAAAFVEGRSSRAPSDVAATLRFGSPRDVERMLETALGAEPDAVARVVRAVLLGHSSPFAGLDPDDALEVIGAFVREVPSPFVEVPLDGLRSVARLAEAHPWLRLAVALPFAASRLDQLPSRRYVSILREGLVVIDEAPTRAPPPIPELVQDLRRELATANDDDEARSAAERCLFEILEACEETRGAFELNGTIEAWFGPRRAEIDLLARALRVAVEVDGYYHFRDAGAYRRDRRKDALLQREGFLVVRVLATDVAERTDEVMDAVLTAVRHGRGKFDADGSAGPVGEVDSHALAGAHEATADER